MPWSKVMMHMLVGAAVGYAYHRLTLPFTGGACPLICSPWRAMALGAVLGLLWPIGGSREVTLPKTAIDLTAYRTERDEMSELTVTPGKPVHVDEATFASLIEGTDVPILLDCYADWCAPCRMLAPHLEALAEQYTDQLIVAKLDVDHHMSLAQQLGIRGIPAMFVIQNGRLVDSWTGYQSADDIATRLKQHLPDAPEA